MRAYIADTECTGTDPVTDQVIELAVMDLPDTVEAFMKAKLEDLPMEHAYFGHSAPMKFGALNTHHINPDDLKTFEPFGGQLANPGGYMIGHNVDFDSDFLGCQGAKRICTLALSRSLFPDIDSHAQGSVLYYIAWATGKGYQWAKELLRDAHAADADVMNCARVLKYIIMVLERRGTPVATWEELYQVGLEARIPKFMTFGEFKGQPMEDVSNGWANWYARQDKTDPYVILGLKRAGVLPE
jgi:exodeoxyribonuclease X